MSKKRVKGQIDLSFGVIFSIILIVAIIGVAFYAITYFLNIKKCSDIAFFYKDLEGEINRAYGSQLYQDVFEGGLPSGIDSVCFGNLSSSLARQYGKEYEFLKRYKDINANLFLYPNKNACDSNLAYTNLEHVKMSENVFFCSSVKNGKVQIKIDKSNFDSLISLSK